MVSMNGNQISNTDLTVSFNYHLTTVNCSMRGDMSGELDGQYSWETLLFCLATEVALQEKR